MSFGQPSSGAGRDVGKDLFGRGLSVRGPEMEKGGIKLGKRREDLLRKWRRPEERWRRKRLMHGSCLCHMFRYIRLHVLTFSVCVLLYYRDAYSIETSLEKDGRRQSHCLS